MCLRNTYSCPSCHSERSELISCMSRSRSRSTSQNPSNFSPHSTPTCGNIMAQNLLATCQNCTTAYRAAYDQTLRRSSAMSRSGSASSVLNGGDVEMEDPHARLLADERLNGTQQWEAYERREIERLCKRRGVLEEEILFS